MTTHEDGLVRIRRLLADDPALRETPVSTLGGWEGSIFSARRIQVVLPDGSLAWREVVLHHGGAGVVALREGRICLVRQWRVVLGRVTLEIPAGKLEAGEPPEECAARELAEETGLRAESLELVAHVWGSPGFSSEQTSVYLAHGLVQGTPRPDADEELSCVWLPLDDVVAAIRAGLIRDGKTVVGALFAAGVGA